MRDIRDRGRDLENVLHQYTTLVKPAFEEFCLPTTSYRSTCRTSSGGAAGLAKCLQVNPPMADPRPPPSRDPTSSLDPTPASARQLPAVAPAQALTRESVVRAHLCIVLQFLAQI